MLPSVTSCGPELPDCGCAPLKKFLAQFCSEMLTMAEEVAQVADGKPIDLATAAERRWLGDLAPALLKIDDLVRKGRYGRRLLSGVTSDRISVSESRIPKRDRLRSR